MDGTCFPYDKKMTIEACDKQSSFARRSSTGTSKKCLDCSGLTLFDEEESIPEDNEKVQAEQSPEETEVIEMPEEQPPEKVAFVSKRVCKDCGVPENETDKFYPSTMQCRKHYMQSYREGVKTGEREVNRDDRNIVEVDFRQFPDLFDRLVSLSKNEMRPPSMQIIYMIKDKLLEA